MIYAVTSFDTTFNLGLSNTPNQWFNVKNEFFQTAEEALLAQTKNTYQYSDVIIGEDEYELQCKIGELIINFMDENFLNNYVYPMITN